MAGVSTVYVIEDGKARQQVVTLGARQDKVIEIVDGLKGDEVLATSNVNQLATGTRVRTGGADEDTTGARRRARAAGAAAVAVAVKEQVNETGRSQRQASGLRHHDDGGAHRARRVLVQGPRPRLDAEDRLAERQRAGPAAGRQRRRGRNPDHQADRGSRQHHQRHRRAAGQLESGSGAGEHHLRARARHRIGHPGRPRQGRHDRRSVSARRETAADHQAGSRRVADPPVQRLRPAVAEGDHPDRRQADQAGARDLEGRRRDQPPGRAQARNPAAVERRPAQRLRPERRSRSAPPSRARTSRCRAATSSPARPRWRSARWAASRTSTISTGSSSPIETARSSRSPTSAGCWTPCRKSGRPTS